MASVASSAKGAARRDEILAIAMRMFAERGFQHTSLREIARALGVETAHVLYYFGSREGLMLAVVQEWLSSGGSAGTVPPAERLDGFVATVSRNARIPGIVRTYLEISAEAAAPDHVAHDFFRERFEWIAAYLAAGIRAEQEVGTARAGIDPERRARALIALADGIQLQWLIEPATDVAGALREAVAEIRAVG